MEPQWLEGDPGHQTPYTNRSAFACAKYPFRMLSKIYITEKGRLNNRALSSKYREFLFCTRHATRNERIIHSTCAIIGGITAR